MIDLWDGYAIDADKCQFVLGKVRTRTRKGKAAEEIYIDGETFHATLAQAVQSFARIQLRKCTAEQKQTLADACKAFADIEKRLSRLGAEKDGGAS